MPPTQVAEKGRNNLDGQLDIFSMMMGDTGISVAPAIDYPDIPELGVREKLLLEKDAAGMYFSGNMLDEYSRHLAILRAEPIADYVGEDADRLFHGVNSPLSCRRPVEPQPPSPRSVSESASLSAKAACT